MQRLVLTVSNSEFTLGGINTRCISNVIIGCYGSILAFIKKA